MVIKRILIFYVRTDSANVRMSDSPVSSKQYPWQTDIHFHQEKKKTYKVWA